VEPEELGDPVCARRIELDAWKGEALEPLEVARVDGRALGEGLRVRGLVVVALGARLGEELAVLREDLEVFLRIKLVFSVNCCETHNLLTASAMGSPTSSLADWRRSGALAVQRKYPKSLAVPMEWKCSTRAFLSLVRAASLPRGPSPVTLLDACSSVAVLLNALAVILVTLACASSVILLNVVVLLNALVTMEWSSLAVMTNVLAGCCAA